MMLKNLSRQNRLGARHHARAMPVVRCSASSTVEPDTSAATRPQLTPRYTAADSGANSPASAGPAQTRSFRRTQGGAPEAPQRPPKQMLPSLIFLEDDADSITRRAKTSFQKYFSQGTGVVVRSLGRQGAAGAMRFILALREEAAAAAAAAGTADADERYDLRIKLLPQEPVTHFGTPLMMFVSLLKGGPALPADGSEQVMDLSVSARTEPERLVNRIRTDLENLQTGHFLRLDMVGTEALHRGLRALNDGLSRNTSSLYYAVPELVSAPMRIRQPQEQQQQEGEQLQPQEAAEASAAANSAGAPAEEPKMVQVLRLYIGRTQGGPAAAAKDARSGRAAAAADGGAGAASATGTAEPGKVTISEAELAELRSALGNMMEQQKQLVQLLGQRQAVVGEAAAAAVGQQQQQQEAATGAASVQA